MTPKLRNPDLWSPHRPFRHRGNFSSPAVEWCRAARSTGAAQFCPAAPVAPAQERTAPRAAGLGAESESPSADRVATTEARRRSGKPGLERRAQSRGPQSRVHGGERGRPPRPSWEAPGARSRSPRSPAPPRPRPRRPRGFSEQRPQGGTRTKPLGCPAGRSGSGPRRRRFGRPATLLSLLGRSL